MATDDCRLVLDVGFDRSVETVLNAFLSEGFRIKPIDGGDLHQGCASAAPLRFAVLEAALPELSFVPCGRVGGLPAILACRISLFELTGSCTLVTAATPLSRYPLLASLVPRISDRLVGAMRVVASRAAHSEAA